MPQGNIKWFNTKNGLGLIIDQDGSTQVRFHFSVVSQEDYKTLQAGDLVEYEARDGRRGPEATRVAKPPKG
ncbi:MAG: cold shock domain-containing protein [Nitrospirota bacterium]|nr:cold shock domain-containing protein [Nitrospirota bacterium]